MAIKRETFLNGKFLTKHAKKEHPVLTYLQRNRGLAFTVKEMVKDLKMKEATIRSMLYILKREKKVLHITPYFIAK